MNIVKHRGLGIGWRPEIALSIERRDDLGFVEIVAENVDPDRIPRPLWQLRERGVQVIPHGISLSLGGAERVDPKRVERLARLAQKFDSPFVSEHIAFVRADGIESGHLLPIPRTRAALDVLVENVIEAKKHLPVPLALENISTLVAWPDVEMDEAEFARAALEQTDCLMLLDVANLYANARNFGTMASQILSNMPLDRIAYCHMGGGDEDADGVYHDTHSHAVPDGAFELLEELCARTDPPGVMLERDDHFPPEQDLYRELDRIAESMQRGTKRRSGGMAHV